MSPVFATRRRAEEFDAVVEGARRTRGASDDRYDDLLVLVGALRAVPEPQARPEFVAELPDPAGRRGRGDAGHPGGRGRPAPAAHARPGPRPQPARTPARDRDGRVRPGRRDGHHVGGRPVGPAGRRALPAQARHRDGPRRHQRRRRGQGHHAAGQRLDAARRGLDASTPASTRPRSPTPSTTSPSRPSRPPTCCSRRTPRRATTRRSPSCAVLHRLVDGVAGRARRQAAAQRSGRVGARGDDLGAHRRRGRVVVPDLRRRRPRRDRTRPCRPVGTGFGSGHAACGEPARRRAAHAGAPVARRRAAARQRHQAQPDRWTWRRAWRRPHRRTHGRPDGVADPAAHRRTHLGVSPTGGLPTGGLPTAGATTGWPCPPST